MRKRILIIFLIFKFVDEIKCDNSLIFNRRLTGIMFTPYTTYNNKSIFLIKSITAKHVKTMLEVVSTKFSRVLIEHVDAVSLAPYERYITYNYFTFGRGKTAEMAAVINKERKRLALTVFIGTFYNIMDIIDQEISMRVALESAEKAESIYPGTVQAIFVSIYFYENRTSAVNTLEWLKIFRSNTFSSGIRIGTKIACDSEGFQMHKIKHNANSIELWRLWEEIILNSDFIILSCTLPKTSVGFGVEFNYSFLESVLRMRQFSLKKINPNVGIMLGTFWPLQDRSLTETEVENLYLFWSKLNNFSTKNNISVWMDGFLDNLQVGVAGWWKQVHYKDLDNASAYVEKISDLRYGILMPEQFVNTNFTHKVNVGNETDWKLYGIIYGIAALFVVLASTYIIYKKWNSISVGVLTRQEVSEFYRGVQTRNFYFQDKDMSYMYMAAMKLPYDKMLEISKNKLEILTNHFLGGGEHGCIYKAVLRDDTDTEKYVALKMVKPNSGSLALKGLIVQIKILSYLGKHSNIVAIIGAYTGEIDKGILYLVTELCTIGSLKSYLQSCQGGVKHSLARTSNFIVIVISSTLPFDDMIRWSYEIACGMEYLEQKKVIHADLASRNVLLSAEKVAKISDLGLSRRLYEYAVYIKTNQEPLPWRWMALESLKASEFTTKSDVWSYGVTLWEIFSLGVLPYPRLAWDQHFVNFLEEGFRLEKPKYATMEIYEIMSCCWKSDKEARPSFKDLKHITSRIPASDTKKGCSNLSQSRAHTSNTEHYCRSHDQT